MDTLDRLAFACGSTSSDHSELPLRVEEMTKANPCLGKARPQDEPRRRCYNSFPGPKVLRKAREQKTYMDLLTNPREEEIKLLLDVKSTKDYTPGNCTLKHYIEAIEMLGGRSGVPEHLTQQAERFEREKKW